MAYQPRNSSPPPPRGIHMANLAIPPFPGSSGGQNLGSARNNNLGPINLAPTNPGPIRATNPSSTGTSALDPIQDPLLQQFYSNQLATNPQPVGNSGNPTHLKPLLLATPHFLETRVQLPAYNPEPFGRKTVKIKSGSKGFVFNGTNMDISDFIKRLEYAAQLDGAQGSDIALQIIFFLEGEPLVKEVQEMAEDENHDWEKLKEKMVQRWGKMFPLLKHTRNDLDNLISSTMVSGIKNQKEFQDFSIKLDNLVAYLVRCKHMASAEEIRHAVLNCLIHPIRISVTKELIRDNQMSLSVDGSHILPAYKTILDYINRELRTMAILDGAVFSEPTQKRQNQPTSQQAPK
ncbi:hypothetical protein PGTUg99_002526 [Puccinia graminis f. sp. tritici]|uniref:Uncharacterized protein n=1 Tax=Puccinia graminis f. sp. tritici TaxID=56615 RepID=A0A5B0QYZ1_PUCGR|nr:hypothetical protein PGTUg99_002526 [Puccinia graminis f. sp. tritici]